MFWLKITLVKPAVFRFDWVGPLKPEFGGPLGEDADEFRVRLSTDITELICSRSVFICSCLILKFRGGISSTRSSELPNETIPLPHGRGC